MLTLHTEQPDDEPYDRATRMLRPRIMLFRLDGWTLMATSLADALDEAEQMSGVRPTRLEIEH